MRRQPLPAFFSGIGARLAATKLVFTSSSDAMRESRFSGDRPLSASARVASAMGCRSASSGRAASLRNSNQIRRSAPCCRRSIRPRSWSLSRISDQRDRLDREQMGQGGLTNALVIREIGDRLPLRTRQATVSDPLLESLSKEASDLAD